MMLDESTIRMIIAQTVQRSPDQIQDKLVRGLSESLADGRLSVAFSKNLPDSVQGTLLMRYIEMLSVLEKYDTHR